MAQSKGQSGQLVYHDLRPTVERSEDTNNHVVRVHLPGFRKEDFRVQVDTSRKLSVKGRRPLGQGNYMLVEQVFEVPEESDIGKISGKFEEGCLTLVMPKKIPSPPTAIPDQEKNKEEKTVQREAEGTQKKEEAPMKETPKIDERKDEDVKQNPRTAEKKADEHIKEEKPVQAEQSKEGAQREKPAEEKKTASAIDEQKVDKKKEEEPIRKDTVKRQESNDKVSCKEMVNKTQKWSTALREKITEMEGWLDYETIDDLLETINRNRNIIGVAALAFSAGFFMSRKLRSSG